MIGAATEVHEAGVAPGAGTFSCSSCGSQVALETLDELPECPRCGGESFRRASMFEVADQPTTTEFPVADHTMLPDWLAEAREEIGRPGRYLAFQEDRTQLYPLEKGWTRIGRSVTADIRLDDPTVSRRHALIVWEPGEPLRVLDDRSLNGVFLNGELVDWGTASDGDELQVGRYRLFVLEA
ncbi:MAG: FHA domain-containing protein [Actinomycetota bacterium]